MEFSARSSTCRESSRNRAPPAVRPGEREGELAEARLLDVEDDEPLAHQLGRVGVGAGGQREAETREGTGAALAMTLI